MSNTFNLIKSLSPGEKKVITTQLKVVNGSKIQLSLFKVLCSNNSYDKNQIIKELSNTSIYKSRYEVLEYDLQRTILRVLRIIYRTKKIKFQLSETLDIIEILKLKSQDSLCLKKINEGIKLAKSIDSNFYLLELLKQEQTIKRKLNIFSKEENHEKILSCINNLYLAEKLRNSYQQIESLRISSYLLNKKNAAEKIKEILSSPLYQSLPSSLDSKNLFYASYSAYQMVMNDYDQIFEYELKRLSVFKESPKAINEHITIYIMALSSLYINSLKLKSTLSDKLFKEINDLKDIYLKKTISIESAKVIMAHLYSTLIKSKETSSKIVVDEKELENIIKVYKPYKSIHFMLAIYHEISYFYFIKGDYIKAHKWLSKLYKENIGINSQNSYVMTLLSYLIHVELGNSDLSEKMQKVIIKQLSSLKTRSNFDELLSNFFISTKKAEEILSNKKVLNELILKMEKAIINTQQTQILNDVNIIAWLISKRDNISFMEALRRYNQTD